ncbi:hypothetical protein [Nocardia amamiensis]|uniref:hypothetical protein n=1 Tax=Nocardia TaxID=1817 RepID=UPI0033E3EBD2
MLVDSGFWQAATVAVPLATAASVLIFALVVGVADGVAPSHDLSKHWVYAAVVFVMTVTGASFAWRRTPTALGTTAGVSTVGLLVAFVWLATA